MPIINKLEGTFDTVAASYEKFRPGYVDALYRAIFDYIPITAQSRVVEVGIGGGQATLPILQTGCTLTAVEYGENFSARCREKFREYPKFSVITGKFEDVIVDTQSYDLVFSASAFHWIPEEIGYPKVFSMLRSGGAFARFANHPFQDKGRPELCCEIERLYGIYYYPFWGKKQTPLVEYSEADAAARAEIAAKYGFDDIRYMLFYRTRTFTAAEYVMLLGTYSDHIAMTETIRREFFSEIEQAIQRHGGMITIYDTLDLQLARKL
ncbi:MAG: class I SAM-dependent methyltransferase [Clostridia bacterium]|nr:class I SAM-dependent methyltransferase [Clostridia bacterium]